LDRYLRDVRRLPLLSHAREQALGQQIQASRQQWQHLLLEHLVHVPLVLAWWPRLRRGALPLTTVCHAGSPPTADAWHTALQDLHSLAGQMRRVVQQQDTPPQTVLALRATMRTLFQDWEWHLEFLQQAWRRFDRAITLATTTRQSRRALAYVATLGYSLAELSALRRDLSDCSSLAEQAKQELVLHNLRLVVRVASMFRSTGVPFSDMIQDGNLGLMRAVDSFDYRRNLKFSTYAVWWIRQAIHRSSASHALVRVPEYLHKDVHRVRRAYDAFVTTHGHAPTTQDMAQRLGIPLERVQRSLEYTPELISLDSPLPGQDRTLQQVLPDTHTPGSEAVLDQGTLHRNLQRALACLTPRETMVICRYFGLDDRPAETLAQIGRDCHLSRERVRQIVKEALAKLKRHEAMRLVSLE
jgi:RNA polymerase sigma factor (sigma-70 family)